MTESWTPHSLCLSETDEISITYSSPNDDISQGSDSFPSLVYKRSQESSGSNIYNTLEPLFPEKIRWFYKEGKLWIPFCGYDSLRLETKYRELAHHSGCNGSDNSKLSEESVKEKIVVRGDLFEVDVLKRIGVPIYWTAIDDGGDSFPIMRGTWFREASWMPLDGEQLADDIEREHLQLFGDLHGSSDTLAMDGFSQQISSRLRLNIKSLLIGGHHVDWYDRDNVFMYADSASHFIRQKIGLRKVGSKITRGYKNSARIDDKLADITHLVFVIHGIGQKMKGGDITFQVSRVRALCRQVASKFFPLLEAANQRVEFLPVEWRKSLILDGDTVDLITPNRNKGFRNAVNTTALDILYYSSPIYRPEMIGSLRSELNRLYSMFCARSPYFEGRGGKVSVLSHSLGTVLLYDILTNWSPAKIYEYLETLDVDGRDQSRHQHQMELFAELNTAKEKVRHLEMMVLTKGEQENTERGQSNFREANFPSNFIDGNLWKMLPKLENLFCVGSPLSVFLALRGLKPQNATSIEQILPENLCRRVFNIFHPADPVVYRMEPLINKSYANIEPVRIYRVDYPHKYSYSDIPANQVCDTDAAAQFDTGTGKNSIDDGSVKSNLESVAYDSLAVKPTLANKVVKFFQKWSSSTTAKFENAVVGKVLSANEMDLLDADSDINSVKFVQRKKKTKRTKQDHNPLINIKNLNQSNLSLSKYVSCRKSSIHRRNLRRLSELQLQRDIEWYFNSCNSDISTKLEPLSQSEESSDNETVTIETESSEQPVERIPKPSPDSPTSSDTTHLKYRIDYKLPESRYESSYLSVLTSHTCYWNSPELCMFMLTHIFEHLGKVGQPW